MTSESMAEKLNRLEVEGRELTHRLAQAMRAGSPETEKILGDIARLEILIGQVEALRRSQEPEQDGIERAYSDRFVDGSSKSHRCAASRFVKTASSIP